MVVKIFVDTNVFSGYLILSGIEERKPDTEKKELWKKYEKIKPCYDFIKKILLDNEKKKIVPFASGLVFSEIFNCIYDEAVCKKMIDDGVPLSSWVRLKNRFSLFIEDFEIEELDNSVYGLFHSKKFKIVADKYDLRLISELILKHHFMTQDSILISTAIKEECKFFVTRDKELIKNWTKMKKRKLN